MASRSSNPSIRETLSQLRQLLDQHATDKDAQWYDSVNEQLERLELALGDEGHGQARSKPLKELTRKHPRRDGRKLLRQSALVVRLAARGYDAGKAPFPELRTATLSLIDGVERYLAMEAELTGEAAQDLGGEG